MHRYVFRRILMLIPVVLGVITIVFILSEINPGDPVTSILGADASEEAKELLAEQLGLNKPLFVRFFSYIWNFISRGDLGISYTTKQPVMSEIMTLWPKTLILAVASVVVSLLVGIPAGILSAVKQYSITDNLTIALSLFLASVPQFWLALMMIIIFSVTLHLTPISGIIDPKGWILPILACGLASAAGNARMTRSSMLEVIRQDYIRTARAKGQKEGTVIFRHAFKNALIPIVTNVGAQIGSAMGGAVTIEKVFSIPGLGSYLVDGVSNHNTPAVLGGILFLSLIFSIVNLLVDVAYAFIDPRIMAKYRQMNRNTEKRKNGSGKGRLKAAAQ